MFITENFVPMTYKGNPYDFIRSLKENNPNIVIATDRRNEIVCVNPTYDYLCLANYYDFLNSISDQWVTAGYLDLGLVPLFMNPSFMGSLEDQVEEIRNAFGISIYSLRPCSFMKSGHIGPNDIWVKREDFRDYLERISGTKVNIEDAQVSMWYRLKHELSKGGVGKK